MQGLREMKKKKREQRIFLAAVELFSEKGFQKTTIKDIAKRAELGVGTLYNYFPTKGDILLSIVSQKNKNLLDAASNLIISEQDDAVVALSRFFNIFIDGFAEFEKSFLNDMLTVSLDRYSNKVEDYIKLDYEIIQRLQTYLLELKHKKMLREDLDVEHAAFALYSILITQAIFYIYMENVQIRFIKEALKKQIVLFYEGLQP